jgi:hypothetical protein
MMRTDIWVARVLGVALVLTVAGCSAPAASDSESHGASDSGAASAETSGEGSDEASSEGEIVAYPVGFPTDEVPMFEGTLLHVAHPGNLWAAWISSDDLVADLSTASQLLLDAGYEQTAAAEGYAEFTNPQRNLRLVASVDGTYGSCLAYTFTDGAVEPEDAVEQDATPEPSEH